MDDSPAETTQDKAPDPVASISGQMPHLSTGDRAALRRVYLTRSHQAEGVIIGLLDRASVAAARWHGPDAFARWRLVAHVAAVLSGSAGRNPHAPAVPLGRALHAAGYSERRLMRLTTARGPALIDQVVRLARYLAGAGAPAVDLRQIHELVNGDESRAEAARFAIARDYYAAQSKADHQAEKDAA